MAKDGCDIILNGHKFDERGEKLIAEIQEMGRKAAFLEADLTKANAAIKLVTDAVAVFGHLDILVNNAAQTIKYTDEYYTPLIQTEEKLLKIGKLTLSKPLV